MPSLDWKKHRRSLEQVYERMSGLHETTSKVQLKAVKTSTLGPAKFGLGKHLEPFGSIPKSVATVYVDAANEIAVYKNRSVWDTITAHRPGSSFRGVKSVHLMKSKTKGDAVLVAKVAMGDQSALAKWVEKDIAKSPSANKERAAELANDMAAMIQDRYRTRG